MCISEGFVKEPTNATTDKLKVIEFGPIVEKRTPVKAASALGSVGLGFVISCATTIFSLYFPFMLQPKAAAAVYLPAFYSYEATLSFFDNSAWTYATDYILALVTGFLAWSCYTADSDASALKRRAAMLLLCYSVSVTAGGIAHQFYTGLESRNSMGFRLLWTVCVGTVTAAGGLMGACASALALRLGHYHVPAWFWVGFGVFTTMCCTGGLLSFQRPAADIFIAGITQFPASFYVTGSVFYKHMGGETSTLFSFMCIFGFILNAPLLPLYAFLLYHTTWSLPAVNTLMHSWLCVTWGMQGLSLLYFIRFVNRSGKIVKKD